jgi:hypothetical protein
MFDQWPELVSPQRARKDLHLGNKNIYNLVKSPGLGIQIGQRYFFIKKNFIAWLERESMKEKSV